MNTVSAIDPAAVPSAPERVRTDSALTRDAVAASNTGQSRRPHLGFLDGIRGLAAMYVLLHHGMQLLLVQFDRRGGNPTVGRVLSILFALLLQYGHYAVDTFIVLSGFVLMMPVALRSDGELPHGFWRYIKRRARRIFPPYYAALVLSLLLIAVLPTHGLIDDYGALPAFTPGAVLSHLFLVHNFSPEWDQRIDPPMWTVVIEWQIYFLFPLLLLPTWRRFGNIGMLVLATVLGLAPFFLFRSNQSVPWYLTLFAFGAAAAVVCFSPRHERLRQRFPWRRLLVMIAAVVIAIQFVNRARWAKAPWAHYVQIDTWGSLWPIDLMVGGGVAMLIISLVQSILNGETPLLLQFLDSTPLVGLSKFSYSLYLIHIPIMFSATAWLYAAHVTPNLMALIEAVVVIPASIVAGYGFYLLFEKPFQSAPAASVRAIP